MEKLIGFVRQDTEFFIYNFVVCSCSIYIICRVITKELIFQWFRDFLLKKKYYWFHELFSCFFCLSVWISAFAAFFFNHNFFLLVVLANFLNIFFLFLEGKKQ